MDINIGDHEEQDFQFIESSYESIKTDLPQMLDQLQSQVDEYLIMNDPNQIRHAIIQEFDYQRQYHKQLFNIVQIVLKSAKNGQDRVHQLHDDLHESQKQAVQYHTQYESVHEEMKRFEQRIKNLEKELEQSERHNENLKNQNSQLQSDLQTEKKEKQKLQKVADRFNKSRQSQNDLLQFEKNNLDVKLKEMEDQLEDKDQHITKLNAKLEQLDNERFKLERQLQALNDDLESVQIQREDEEQMFNKLLDDKIIIIESMKNQLAQKDQELKKYMIQEQSLKSQEQFQSIGDLILRNQITPKQSLTDRDDQQVSAEQPNGGLSAGGNSPDQKRRPRLSLEEPGTGAGGNLGVGPTEEEYQLMMNDPNMLLASAELRNSNKNQSLRQPRQKFIFANDMGGAVQKVDRDVQTNDLELYGNDLEEFEEYQEVDMSEIQRSQMKKNITMSMITETHHERKDPEEEYFRLTVLSVKMIHNERDQEFVVDVNPQKLYRQAQFEEIPFHLWFYWVDKHITELAQLQQAHHQKNGFMSKLRNIFARQKAYQSENPFLE